jgi:hypothetical protein
MVTVQKTRKNFHTIDDLKMVITEYIRNVDLAILSTVFENTVRIVNKCLGTGGDNLKITSNFLCCNHPVHRDFLITLYKDVSEETSTNFGQASRFVSLQLH